MGLSLNTACGAPFKYLHEANRTDGEFTHVSLRDEYTEYPRIGLTLPADTSYYGHDFRVIHYY